MHCWVARPCSNSQQKQFSDFFFPFTHPNATGYKIHNSRQSGYSDRHRNQWAHFVSMNLSACCFHLGVTSIICQSCPQILTEEKRWVIMELGDMSSCALTHLGDIPPRSKQLGGQIISMPWATEPCFAFCCSICCIIGDNVKCGFYWAYKTGGRFNLDWNLLCNDILSPHACLGEEQENPSVKAQKWREWC